MENNDFETVRHELTELLENKNMRELKRRLEEMNEFDVAEFLSTLDQTEMATVFRMLSKSMGAEIFANLEVEEQEYIINSITDTELENIVEDLYVDDAVDMMEELPASVVKRVMRMATPETRNLINQYLKYPDNSAGSIMTAEYVDLKKYMNVRECIARIRRIGEDRETIYTCFVTDADRKLEGVITVKDLLLAPDEAVVGELMDAKVIYATTTEDQEEVSNKFSDYDLLAIPVVDMEGRLVGIVTVDDVIDVIEAEATEDIEKMAAITPSDRPYMRTGVFELFKNRIPWLLLLMISATFTGMIITSFEDSLAAQAALAAFIPMLMDSGGNSGSQASVTVIRAISLGDVQFMDIFKVLWKEFRVSIMCGTTLAAANFIKIMIVDVGLMGNDGVTVAVAAVVCLTLVVTVICAEFVGSSLPILAKRLGFDPAVMASPFITTIVDTISLAFYFFFAKTLLGV